MPSPFPGMDPYLEGHLWTSFHHELAVAVKYQLSPQLLPGYFAFTERYLLTDTGEEAMAIPHEVPHYRLAIRDIKEQKLATIVEFMSPVNKRGQGRRLYLRKRNRILRSSTHLLEFDLLRRGKRAPMEEEYRPGNYFVIVSRARRRPRAEVWPIPLPQSLPIIPIPLLGKDPDVSLDLQQAVTSVYDMGRFIYMIDYHKPPDVRLTTEEDAWADQILRAQGKR